MGSENPILLFDKIQLPCVLSDKRKLSFILISEHENMEYFPLQITFSHQRIKLNF